MPWDRILKFAIGGLLYYQGDSDDASLNPTLNAAMLMKRYAQIASTEERKAAYLVSIILIYIPTLHSLFNRITQKVK